MFGKTSLLALGGLVVLGTVAASEELVRPFAPAEPTSAARPSLFLPSLAPQPRGAASAEAAAEPLDIRPSKEGIAAALAAAPKPANVPLPPRIERPRAAPKDGNTATEPAPPSEAPRSESLAPVRAEAAKGGFFAWLSSQYEEPAPRGREEVASLSPVISSRRLDPGAPRTPGRDDPADDDLEDEETKKLVEKQAPHVEIACLRPRLMRLIHAAGEHFKGTPVITSGYRNRGRRGSYHRKCEAADFFITGVSGGQLTSFLRKLPGAGGVGTYCHTKSVHIDTGDPRDWHQCGFRRRFSLRAPVVAQIGSR